jgi:hypothetical protein
MGHITAVNEDGHLNRQTLGSVSLFRGRGDIVFYHRDLFTPRPACVILVMERDGLELRFRWNPSRKPSRWWLRRPRVDRGCARTARVRKGL